MTDKHIGCDHHPETRGWGINSSCTICAATSLRGALATARDLAERAPHGPECNYIQTAYTGGCNCWKAAFFAALNTYGHQDCVAPYQCAYPNVESLSKDLDALRKVNRDLQDRVLNQSDQIRVRNERIKELRDYLGTLSQELWRMRGDD